MKPTLTEKLMAKLQNNRPVAILILAGTLVIALASFTDAAKSLLSVIVGPNPEEARLKLASLSVDFTEVAFLGAAEAGDLAKVNLFIAAGMDPGLTQYADEGGATPLFYAAKEKHPAVVEALLKAGAPVTGPHNRALSGAVRSGQIAMLERLLKMPVTPADLNVAFTTPDASRPMLEILLAHGAEIKKAGPEALLYASEPDAVNFLLAHGADINSRDAQGLTLIERLDYNTINLDTLKILIDRGADLNTRNKTTGRTLLQTYAARGGLKRAIEMLLTKGVNVNTPDPEGRTALSLACEFTNSIENDTATVRLLLQRGADVNARDLAGNTPLFYARHRSRYPNAEAIKMLLDHGAQ